MVEWEKLTFASSECEVLHLLSAHKYILGRHYFKKD